MPAWSRPLPGRGGAPGGRPFPGRGRGRKMVAHEQCRARPGRRRGRRSGLPRRRARGARARLRLGPAPGRRHRRDVRRVHHRHPAARRCPGVRARRVGRQGSAVRRGPGPARHPRHRVARVRAVPAAGACSGGRTFPAGTCCSRPYAARGASARWSPPWRCWHPGASTSPSRLAVAAPRSRGSPGPSGTCGSARSAAATAGGWSSAGRERRTSRCTWRSPPRARSRATSPRCHRRPHLRRRRRALADQRRGPARARPGPRDRRLADVRALRPPDRPVRRVPLARRAGGPQRGPGAAPARDRGRRLPARVGRAGGDGQRLHGPEPDRRDRPAGVPGRRGRTPPAPARGRSSPASASTAAADRPATSPHRTHRSARIRTLRVRIRAARCVRSRNGPPRGRTGPAATAGCRRRRAAAPTGRWPQPWRRPAPRRKP